MKRLISLISTSGKSPEQLAKEVWDAYQKFLKVKNDLFHPKESDQKKEPKKKKLKFKLFSAIVLLFFGITPLHAKDCKPSFDYKVVSVLDGDTFIATDGNVTFKVRIAAMDAPEHGQPYSKMAKNKLEQILKFKNITIKPVGKGHDRYGRVLGHIFSDGQDVALLMIQEGLATYYRPFCRDYPEDKNKYNYDPEEYVKEEKEARKLKKNMWFGENSILPCKHRRGY